MDALTLRDALIFLTTSGAAVAAYWVMNRIPAPIRARLSPASTRVAAMLLAFVVADLAWLAQVVMLYQPEPSGWRAWIEVVFAVGAPASGVNQWVHGYLDLPKPSDAAPPPKAA